MGRGRARIQNGGDAVEDAQRLQLHGGSAGGMRPVGRFKASRFRRSAQQQ